MPWIKDGTKEKFVPPPRPAEIARPPTDWKSFEAQRAATLRHAYRVIAEWHELYKHCPRHACRRAGACRGADVPCHEQALPWLKKHFYREFLRRIRGDARYDPDARRRAGDPSATSPPSPS